MQGYNVIAVYSQDLSKLLMCKRRKNPFIGLYNLVGGKIEHGEEGIKAAYRELLEETGISGRDITLTHLMDFTYHLSNCFVEVYAGRLAGEVAVSGDENELVWMDSNGDFFDTGRFAGGGNIGHIIEEAKVHADAALR